MVGYNNYCCFHSSYVGIGSVNGEALNACSVCQISFVAAAGAVVEVGGADIVLVVVEVVCLDCFGTPQQKRHHHYFHFAYSDLDLDYLESLLMVTAPPPTPPTSW